MKKILFPLFLLALGFIPHASAKSIDLLNVSYDPTRELYQDYNTRFSITGKSRRATT